MVLHTEDDRGHDHCGEGGLGYEGAVVHEEGEAEQDQCSSVETSHGCPDTTGAVDCSPRE